MNPIDRFRQIASTPEAIQHHFDCHYSPELYRAVGEVTSEMLLREFPDVFLSAVGQQVLLENRLVPDGRLWLEDVSFEAGVAVSAIGFSAAAADVNEDGQLDIYVTSYNRYGQIMPDAWDRATNGMPNLLFMSSIDPATGATLYRERAAALGVDELRTTGDNIWSVLRHKDTRFAVPVAALGAPDGVAERTRWTFLDRRHYFFCGR